MGPQYGLASAHLRLQSPLPSIFGEGRYVSDKQLDRQLPRHSSPEIQALFKPVGQHELTQLRLRNYEFAICTKVPAVHQHLAAIQGVRSLRYGDLEAAMSIAVSPAHAPTFYQLREQHRADWSALVTQHERLAYRDRSRTQSPAQQPQLLLGGTQ